MRLSARVSKGLWSTRGALSGGHIASTGYRGLYKKTTHLVLLDICLMFIGKSLY